MKTLFGNLAFSLIGLLLVFSAHAQTVKSNTTFAEATANKQELTLIADKQLSETLVKNFTSYYKDFFSVTTEAINAQENQVKIVSFEAEKARVIKRLLTVSEVKEIQFLDKKVNLEEYFGF